MINLKAFANKIFGWIYDKFPEFFSITKEFLPKANIRMPTRTYVSLGFLYASIAYVLSFFMISMVLNLFDFFLFLKIAFLIFLPFFISIIVFLIYIFAPYFKAQARKRDIETNLPFGIAHMGAVVGSGVPPQMVFKILGEYKEYGEFAVEMRRISKNMELFGMDPVSAVRQVALTTPSESLRELLSGFISTTESGGNIKFYLRNAGKQALFEWRAKRQRFVQQLSTYAEFYTGILIAAPLFLISLFSVMNMISPRFGGFAILDLMRVSIYALIPIMNGGFLAFLHYTQVEM
jgi:flagellar protein FlaJ